MRKSLLARVSVFSISIAALAGCDDGAPPAREDGGLVSGDDGAIAMLDGATPAIDGSSTPLDGGPPPTPSGYVDPMCRDGMYRETPPDISVSIADLSFSGDVPALVDAALMRRYPFGLDLVRGGRMRTGAGDCSELFAGSPASAMDLYRSLDTIVHECGHFADGRLSSGSTNVYLLRASLQHTCMRGDTTSRGGDTRSRSRIRTDAYQSLRAPCVGFGRDCDFYADTYLDGNPDDATFQGGDQGFNMLLEEVTQYVNSLVTAWAFADQMPTGSSTSARDGILTLLWYLERYLHLARSTYPAAYARIADDACWRDAVLDLWGRAWLYLEHTRELRGLGIDDDAIELLVADPVLLDEIDRLRTASGCS